MLPIYIKPSDYGRTDSYILGLAIKQLRIRCRRKVTRFIRRRRLIVALANTASILLTVLRLLVKSVEAL